MSLRTKLFAIVLAGFAILLTGFGWLYYRTTTELIRPLAFLSLSISADAALKGGGSSQTPPYEFRLEIPLTAAGVPIWRKMPPTVKDPEALRALAKLLNAEAAQSRLLSGGFELDFPADSPDTRHYFISYRKVGETVVFFGSSSARFIDQLSVIATPLALILLVAFLVTGIAVYLVAAYLARAFERFAVILGDVGAGRLDDIELVNYPERELRTASEALKNLVSLLRARNEQLAKVTKLADEDSMTQLPNYRAFSTFINGMKADILSRQGNESGNTLAVVALVDIDFFKKVNDGYGHQVGDLVLKHMGEVIKKNVRRETPNFDGSLRVNTARASDFCARYGGEEFVVVYSQCNIEHRHVAPVRLLNAIRAMEIIVPKELSNTGQEFTLKITASIGFAKWEQDRYQTMQHWIKAADVALYEAKRRGRARVVEGGKPIREWTQ